jgi:hypothetical protein
MYSAIVRLLKYTTFQTSESICECSSHKLGVSGAEVVRPHLTAGISGRRGKASAHA